MTLTSSGPILTARSRLQVLQSTAVEVFGENCPSALESSGVGRPERFASASTRVRFRGALEGRLTVSGSRELMMAFGEEWLATLAERIAHRLLPRLSGSPERCETSAPEPVQPRHVGEDRPSVASIVLKGPEGWLEVSLALDPPQPEATHRT